MTKNPHELQTLHDLLDRWGAFHFAMTWGPLYMAVTDEHGNLQCRRSAADRAMYVETLTDQKPGKSSSKLPFLTKTWLKTISSSKCFNVTSDEFRFL